MRFEPSQPEAEFQTGHALWALQAAGIPADNPQVAKGLAYLLGRQQSFGGWMDPFSPTRISAPRSGKPRWPSIALSSYYPAREPARKAGTRP